MNTYEDSMSKLLEALGFATTIAWSLFLGPVGAALLLGTSCAFVSGKPLAGIACALVAAAPVLLGAVWLVVACSAFIVLPDRRMGSRLPTVPGRATDAVPFL